MNSIAITKFEFEVKKEAKMPSLDAFKKKCFCNVGDADEVKRERHEADYEYPTSGIKTDNFPSYRSVVIRAFIACLQPSHSHLISVAISFTLNFQPQNCLGIIHRTR